MNNANTERKDIYWQGRIYHVNPDALMPGFVSRFPQYTDRLGEYFKRTKTQSIDLIGSHSFKDGQPVIEGKDYEMQCKYGGMNCVEIGGHRCRIVAIPLDSKEEGEIEAVKFAEWFYRIVAMKDQEGRWIVTTSYGLNYKQTYTTKELYDIFKTQK